MCLSSKLFCGKLPRKTSLGVLTPSGLEIPAGSVPQTDMRTPEGQRTGPEVDQEGTGWPLLCQAEPGEVSSLPTSLQARGHKQQARQQKGLTHSLSSFCHSPALPGHQCPVLGAGPLSTAVCLATSPCSSSRVSPGNVTFEDLSTLAAHSFHI